MKYNVINYLIGEGFRNVFKNKKSTISALTIMCLCMLVFGIFFIIGENINNIMNAVQSEQGMQVFIKVGTSSDRVKEIGNKIKEINGINNVQYVSKAEALQQVKEGLKDNASVAEAVPETVFPESYIVTLTDLKLNKQVQTTINEIVGNDLDEIVSGDETISKLLSIANGIKIFTFGLLVILVAISLVIISNTIKLTVHARRKEISIMKYVGATNSFIRWPFIVEGIIIGIISALIAILIIGLAYNAIIPKMLELEVVKEMDIITFVSFSDMFSLMLIVYFILGIGIGVIGSSISMRKYLEV